MSELGDLLELVHCGGARDETIQATVTSWYHVGRSHDAFLAGAEEEGSAVTFYAAADDASPPLTEQTWTTRLWLAPPDRAREERDDHIAVRRGRLWWRYSPEEGAISNEAESEVSSDVGAEFTALLDPGSLLGALTLKATGRGELHGRPAIFATAHPRDRRDEDASWTLHRLGHGADEWRLAVDAEHGVLLRVEALRDGEPFSRIDLLDLVIGEPIDDDVFVFTAPAGEEIQPLDMPRVDNRLGVDELVERAPFTVFVPDRLGEDWELDLRFQEASSRRSITATAFVHLRSEGGHWSASITQQASDDAIPELFDSLDAPEHWRVETRDGRELHVREPPEPWATALVRTELDGTHIQIASADLGVDRLADLATRLIRAPAQPPDWS